MILQGDYDRGRNLPLLISSLPSSIKSEVISLSPMNCWNPKRFKQRVPKLVKEEAISFVNSQLVV